MERHERDLNTHNNLIYTKWYILTQWGKKQLTELKHIGTSLSSEHK